jgi:hypothetical protein
MFLEDRSMNFCCLCRYWKVNKNNLYLETIARCSGGVRKLTSKGHFFNE